MKSQCCTLSVFYVTRRETIIAPNFKVFSFRLVHVIHVVSPDRVPDNTSPPAIERVLAHILKGFLRYILVKVVEPNPTGRSKRTFKPSTPNMDVVTAFMKTV